VVIQFGLFATLSRVCCVSMKGDPSPDVSSSVENSAMLAGGCGRGRGRGPSCGHDSGGVDAEIRGDVFVLTVVKTVIYQISARTSLVNLSGLKLLVLPLL